MDQRRLAYIIVSMVTVAVIAILMLNNMFEEVPRNHKILIVISATLFSGLFARALFPAEQPDEAEPKNKNNLKK
ncbi:hypothetical protein NST62_13505 [Ureibacillus sp. FSL K6-8385]|uniref:Uncharacterized protein n=1 Tax=Ureibacillus terrenus TaxID=118246 RepID=A0A540V2Q1_9BACL|nr:hypothetical protein [Ureibacillus terrenus]MED3661672.1 hypothetical protein [Ureibacillus terrenus]MED3763546.1 hypothetical protein [Ureibacillus terrenus]TQE91035.1 hypothetical protein FKZ59_06890 [Ureibacillus terrenus]